VTTVTANLDLGTADGGMIRERVNAGLARARANGTKLGRRRVDPTVEAQILELKASGDGILKIGRKLGIGTSVVQRVFKQVEAITTIE
jgi:DNA invertase Pin-like site-specific DNA recombinase